MDSFAPRLFSDLVGPHSLVEALTNTSLQSNPPHLLLSGPPGCGKTAAYRLICRQVLGPAWEATTHVLQARDLSKTSGAMAKFETFLRPSGAGSEDTLAGRTSLDAFDQSLSVSTNDSPWPAGQPPEFTASNGRAPVSRIIVIEDADYLGHARQSYLRRMMEESSRSARFIFTTHTPSRMIEAIRSRVQHLRFPSLTRVMIEQRLNAVLGEEGHDATLGLVGDVAHVANGNLRKGLFMLQLLAERELLQDRKHVQMLMANTSLREVQLIIEEALRNRVHEWRWEKHGEKNSRVLKGAMGALDQLMNAHEMDAMEVVSRIHQFLTAGRSHYPPALLTDLLNALAACDASLQRSAQGRIQLEVFLHRVAEIGAQYPGL